MFAFCYAHMVLARGMTVKKAAWWDTATVMAHTERPPTVSKSHTQCLIRMQKEKP